MFWTAFEYLSVSGLRRLYDDIELMLGRKLTPVWGIFWSYITPVLIVVGICMEFEIYCLIKRILLHVHVCKKGICIYLYKCIRTL